MAWGTSLSGSLCTLRTVIAILRCNNSQRLLSRFMEELRLDGIGLELLILMDLKADFFLKFVNL